MLTINKVGRSNSREFENVVLAMVHKKEKHKKGVGIITNKKIERERCRYWEGDGIIRIKLVLGKEILNIISAYVAQVRLEDYVKKEFEENMDAMIYNIPIGRSLS